MIGDHARLRVHSKIAKDVVSVDGEEMTSDEFCTPPRVANPLAQFFGGPVGIDPCSNERSIVLAHEQYSAGGLVLPWCRRKLISTGDTGYSNWPYSTNEPWADKAIRELALGHVRELVILCMTSTSTTWWSNLMRKPKRNPRVICTGRFKFLGPDGRITKHTCRFDPSLIYFGPRWKAFDREFGHLARWITWGR